MPDHESVSPTGETDDPRSCEFAWCTTTHGRTVHPADETHRSAGLSVRIDFADPARRDTSESVEIGLVRPWAAEQTWLVVEREDGRALTMSLESARRVWRTVHDDPDLRGVLTSP